VKCRVCGAELPDTPEQNPEYLPPEVREMMRRKLHQKTEQQFNPVFPNTKIQQNQPQRRPQYSQFPAQENVQTDQESSNKNNPNQQSPNQPPNQQFPNQPPNQQFPNQQYQGMNYINPATGMMYNQQGFAPITIRPPIEPTASSILQSLIQFLKSPSTSKGNFENSNAPRITFLVLVSALFTYISGYMVANQTTSIGETSQLSPIVSGIEEAIFFLLSFFVGSIILSYLVRGSMPINSPLRYRSRDAVLKLNAIRSLFFIPLFIARSIFLYMGESQIIQYTTTDPQEIFTNPETAIVIVKDFSQQYYQITGIFLLLGYIISSIYLYFGLKGTFEVHGSRPLILSLLTLAFGILLYTVPH